MVKPYTVALALTDSFKQQRFARHEAVQVNWSQLHHEIALAALYTAYGAVLTCTSPLLLLWG
jgi:hypothetical protein